MTSDFVSYHHFYVTNEKLPIGNSQAPSPAAEFPNSGKPSTAGSADFPDRQQIETRISALRARYATAEQAQAVDVRGTPAEQAAQCYAELRAVRRDRDVLRAAAEMTNQ